MDLLSPSNQDFLIPKLTNPGVLMESGSSFKLGSFTGRVHVHLLTVDDCQSIEQLLRYSRVELTQAASEIGPHRWAGRCLSHQHRKTSLQWEL